MIQIAIVEDEEIYVKQLTEYIRKYQTERGRSIKVTVFGDGEDITDFDINHRANAGIGYAFQQPPRFKVLTLF